MNLAIITVQRSVEYLYRSLFSLTTSGAYPGPVHLFVGTDETEYLDALAGNPRVVVHPMPAEDWERIGPWEVRRRFTFNYSRCLAHFADGGEGLCVCEDDVLYAEGFWGLLQETVSEVEARLREYVLALYAMADYGADPSLRRGRLYSAYPAGLFFGTQGMYYPAAVIREQASRLRDVGLHEASPPGDLVIRDFCDERGYLYVARRSLVQHIGRVSTGLGNFHRSSTFHGDDPGPGA